MIFALFVADHHGDTEEVCVGGGGFGEADIRAADDEVGDIE